MENSECIGKCALCTSPKRQCGPAGDFIPEGICSTEIYRDIADASTEKYKLPEFANFAKQAGRQSDAAHGKRQGNDVRFPDKSRIQETIEFMHRMKYKKIGLAFCGAVHPEATKLNKILEANGFEVVSVCCKVGMIGREAIGISEEEARRHGTVNNKQCNPIFQADILNHEKTEFNILLGLCVGHDSLFMKNSDAMVTVLASKDRLTCNNAMAPLYLADWHWKRLYNPEAYDEYDEETGDLIPKGPMK